MNLLVILRILGVFLWLFLAFCGHFGAIFLPILSDFGRFLVMM
jgi:hypothetical protein